MEISHSKVYGQVPAVDVKHHLAESHLPLNTTTSDIRGKSELDRGRRSDFNESSCSDFYSIEEHVNLETLPKFRKTLFNELKLAESIKHVICPVLIEENRYLLFCQRADAATDLVKEIQARLLELDYEMEPPGCIFVSRQILLSLARSAISTNLAHHAQRSGEGSRTSRKGKEAGALYQLFEQVLGFALQFRASDIHFNLNLENEYTQIQFRIDGKLTKPSSFNLQTQDVHDMLAYCFSQLGQGSSEPYYVLNRPQQCMIQATINSIETKIRYASHPTLYGSKVVFRIHAQYQLKQTKTLHDLGYLPDQIEIWQRAIKKLGGVILLSGVVGSGKSTTLQALGNMLPAEWSVYAIEEPVEIEIPGATHFNISRKINENEVHAFLGAARQIKRMDPDVVLIGEIRDRVTAQLMRDVCESGHRVFTTIHAPSAIDVLSLRLCSQELGLPRDILATPGFVNLLVYQALIPKLCPSCKRPALHEHERVIVKNLTIDYGLAAEAIYFTNENGCGLCRNEQLPELNGCDGRIPVAEMVEPDEELLRLFRLGEAIELRRHLQSTRRARWDEPDTQGKSAWQVALYFVSQGLVSPLELERKFGAIPPAKDSL